MIINTFVTFQQLTLHNYREPWSRLVEIGNRSIQRFRISNDIKFTG